MKMSADMTSVRMRADQRGLSMIEILVSLTIVAFGLLGLAGLQARSMSMSKDSSDRKAAAEIAAQLAERMQANFDGFRRGSYTLTMNPLAAGPTFNGCQNAQECTEFEVADRDLAQWAIELRRRLPVSGAYIVVAPDGASATVTVAWQEGQAVSDGNADPDCPNNLDVSYRCIAWELHP